MMKFQIEVDQVEGMTFAMHISPLVIKLLAPILATILSLPWLVQIARAIGWM